MSIETTTEHKQKHLLTQCDMTSKNSFKKIEQSLHTKNKQLL